MRPCPVNWVTGKSIWQGQAQRLYLQLNCSTNQSVDSNHCMWLNCTYALCYASVVEILSAGRHPKGNNSAKQSFHTKNEVPRVKKRDKGTCDSLDVECNIPVMEVKFCDLYCMLRGSTDHVKSTVSDSNLKTADCPVNHPASRVPFITKHKITCFQEWFL